MLRAAAVRIAELVGHSRVFFKPGFDAFESLEPRRLFPQWLEVIDQAKEHVRGPGETGLAAEDLPEVRGQPEVKGAQHGRCAFCDQAAVWRPVTHLKKPISRATLLPTK